MRSQTDTRETASPLDFRATNPHREDLPEPTIPAMFRARVRKSGPRPSMYDLVGADWVPVTWDEYGRQVDAIAGYLASLGIGAGDRVAILSYNRPQWHIADVAIAHLGAVTVPIYFTNSPAQVEYVLEHSESRVVFVQDRAQLAKVTEVQARLPCLEATVVFDGEAGGDAMLWQQALAAGLEYHGQHSEELERARNGVGPDDLCTIIYTSGTTGPPKGVMLTHYNLLWTLRSFNEMLPAFESDSSVSYLPLAHIFEKFGGHMQQIYSGRALYFAPSIDRLGEVLQSVQPTFVYGVPRVWEKMYAQVAHALEHMGGIQGALARWAVATGHLVERSRHAGRPPGIFLTAAHALADRLVLGKLRHRLGMGRGRVFISSAAPIAPDILVFFHAIGVPILEVYGATEATGPVTVNPSDAIHIGTVGRAIPGDDVKIAPDGEVLVRGGNVFQGYYHEPEQSAETLRDGWYLTGDVGEIDADGYLRITDRKKDLIITAGGKNISPANIEIALKRQGFISQAVAIGDKRPFMSALVTLNPETIGPWASAHGLDPTDSAALAADPAVRDLVQECVDRVNADLSQVEKIKKFSILPNDFQVTDELTPTLKVKRKVVAEKYRNQIEAMYS
ncbi:MAG: AMP-dependent synthetase/ligase [Candidatus Dormibacteria bacterium]